MAVQIQSYQRIGNMEELLKQHYELSQQIAQLRQERAVIQTKIHRIKFKQKHGVTPETYYRRLRNKK